MAVLGPEILLIFATAVTLVRSAGVLALPTRLFRGLVYYTLPHDGELRQMFGSQSSDPKKKNRSKGTQPETDFKVPKGEGAISLDPRKITSEQQLLGHLFYLELETLMSLVFAASVVVMLVDFYYGAIASPEMARSAKYSLVWLYLALLYSGKTVYDVSALYFKSPRELLLLSSAAVVMFAAASAALMNDGSLFDFDLQLGFEAVVNRANVLLQESGLLIKVDPSPVRYKIAMAGVSGILGGLLFYPSVRMARSHVAATGAASASAVERLLLNIGFLAPALLSLAWVRPLARDAFRDAGIEMTPDQFDRWRIGAVVAACLLRVFLARVHLQAYLNQAFARVRVATLPSTRKVTVAELRTVVDNIYRLVVVIAVQLLAPTLLLLCACLALKMQGGFQWWQSATAEGSTTPDDDSGAYGRDHPVTLFSRGFFSYLCWWLCTAQGVLGALGFLYVKVAEKSGVE